MTSKCCPCRLAIALFVVLPLLGALQDPPPAQAGDGALLSSMEGIKGNLKSLATRLRAEDGRDDCLAAVAEMQRLALVAKLQVPPRLESLPADEGQAHREVFRREMNALCVSLLALEVELLDGDVEEAWARISGPLFQQREAAHRRFQPQEH